MAKARVSPWDLTALLNAADPKASLPERHLWLIRLLEWLRHAPVEGEAQVTPTPVLRLKHLLGVLDRHPSTRCGSPTCCGASGARSTTLRCSPISASRHACTCGASSDAACARVCCR